LLLTRFPVCTYNIYSRSELILKMDEHIINQMLDSDFDEFDDVDDTDEDPTWENDDVNSCCK